MTDKVKEIQLTEGRVRLTYYDTCSMNIDITEPTLFLPPKRKTVKLSELPDGTVISTTDHNNAFVVKGKMYWGMDTNNEGYTRILQAQHVDVIESPKQVWEGGPCPVPDGVIVRYCVRWGEIRESDARGLTWEHNDAMSDIIWYQILRLADGWELVR